MTEVTKIRYYRKLNKLSQQDVADYCHVSREAVANWEGGHRLPNIMIIKDLAKFFNVTVSQLVGCKERYYVLSSFLNNKIDCTHYISKVLNFIKGILSLIIIIPLMISIPLKIKENEEREIYSSIINNEVTLYLKVKHNGLVSEHEFSRIEKENLENITNQYNILEPNHEEIECAFILENINDIIPNMEHRYHTNALIYFDVKLKHNLDVNKVIYIKYFKHTNSIHNKIHLSQNQFEPKIRMDKNNVHYPVINPKYFQV